MSLPEDRFISINGLNLHYLDWGSLGAVPSDFGSLTRELSYKDLEALQKELKKYLQLWPEPLPSRNQ